MKQRKAPPSARIPGRWEGKPSLGHGTRLAPREQDVVIRLLAEHWRPPQIVEYLEREFGKRVAPNAIVYYAQAERWKPAIKRYRDALAARVSEIPIGSKYFRLLRRQELYEKVEREIDAVLSREATPLEGEAPEDYMRRMAARMTDVRGFIAEARGLLMDSAKDAGDIVDDATYGVSPEVLILVQQVMQLPEEVRARYARGEKLRPGDWKRLPPASGGPIVDAEEAHAHGEKPK